MPYVSGLTPEELSAFLKDKAQLAANAGTTLAYQIQVWALKSGYDDQQLAVYLATFPANWKEKLPEWETAYKATPQAVSPHAAVIQPIDSKIVLSESDRAEVVAGAIAEGAVQKVDPSLVLYRHVKALRLTNSFCDTLMSFQPGTTEAYERTLKIGMEHA